MSLRDKWGGYVTTGLVAFTSGITLYLIISDTARRSEIRRRKNILSTLDDETAITALERAQHRFSVLRIGGRFVNPFDEYSSLICAFLGRFSWCLRFELIVDGGNRELGSGLCGRS